MGEDVYAILVLCSDYKIPIRPPLTEFVEPRMRLIGVDVLHVTFEPNQNLRPRITKEWEMWLHEMYNEALIRICLVSFERTAYHCLGIDNSDFGIPFRSEEVHYRVKSSIGNPRRIGIRGYVNRVVKCPSVVSRLHKSRTISAWRGFCRDFVAEIWGRLAEEFRAAGIEINECIPVVFQKIFAGITVFEYKPTLVDTNTKRIAFIIKIEPANNDSIGFLNIFTGLLLFDYFGLICYMN